LALINDASYQHKIWGSSSLHERSVLQYETENLLKFGEIKNYEHKIAQGVTGAKILEIEMQAYGVFKENKGSSANNEVLAYEVDKLFSFDLVPVTVLRTYKGKRGSFQLFMRNTTMGENYKGSVARSKIGKLRVFDFLLGGLDRHPENYLFDSKGKIIAIDHEQRSNALTKDIRIGHSVKYSEYWSGAVFLRTEDGRKLVSHLKKISNREIFQKLGPYLKIEHIQSLIKRKKALEDYLKRL